jgi:hypothetical protein
MSGMTANLPPLGFRALTIRGPVMAAACYRLVFIDSLIDDRSNWCRFLCRDDSHRNGNRGFALAGASGGNLFGR